MRRPALTVLALCSFLAACGGNSGISETDYAKQADAICRRHQAQLGLLTPARTPKEIVDFVSSSLPVLRADVAALKRLPVPEREKDLVARWLARGDRAIAALVDLRRAARQGAIPAIRDITAAAEENATAADALARELGLKECSI